MTKPRSNELTEALSALIVQQPFFACLLIDLLKVEEVPPDSPIPTACTDGLRIMINPKFFKSLGVDERMFVLAHEVAHVIMQHPDRMKKYTDLGVGPDLKPYSNGKFNRAADYVINAYLTELKVGKQPLGSLSNPHISSKDLVDDVYCQLPDEPEDESGGGGWDHHTPATGETADKATIQRAVAQAATAQKMRGKLPGGLQRLVDELCETQVSWQDYLRKTIVCSQGSDQSTWARPNRRRLAAPPHIYWPGRCGSRAGNVAVEIDTSGSIGERELQVFLSELQGILSDVQPETIYAMYVDAALQGDIHEIHDVGELMDLGRAAAGGGGTDMTIAMQEIESRQLDVEYLVVLTDGYTPFGDDPGYPVIWCVTSEIVAPWGTTVHVKL